MIGIWQHQSLYIDTSTTIIHCIYTIRLNNSCHCYQQEDFTKSGKSVVIIAPLAAPTPSLVLVRTL
jgi:hypothetical protein